MTHFKKNRNRKSVFCLISGADFLNMHFAAQTNRFGTRAKSRSIEIKSSTQRGNIQSKCPWACSVYADLNLSCWQPFKMNKRKLQATGRCSVTMWARQEDCERSYKGQKVLWIQSVQEKKTVSTCSCGNVRVSDSPFRLSMWFSKKLVNLETCPLISQPVECGLDAAWILRGAAASVEMEISFDV